MGVATWLAGHIFYAITQKPGTHGWFIHFLIFLTLSTIMPILGLIASWQETLEWSLRIVILVITGAGGTFTAIIAWPKVKGILNKKVRRKR